MAVYNFLNDRGVIVPDTSNIRADVEAEYRAAFGDDLSLDPSTPQGVLITAEVQARDAVARNNAEVANQINPDIAEGVFLDAIWRLLGGSRRGPVKSIINDVVFFGVPGTIIPAGSLARTQAGDRFETIATYILDATGNAIGSVRAVEFGPIAAPANTLIQVASSVLGWETVNNPLPAIVGREEESNVRARRRRRETLALQTVSVSEAIISRLYDIDTVRSLSFRENVSDDSQTIDGILMKPHSIYVCVEGGTDDEIAQALYETKTIGAGYNGAVSVSVVDEFSGQISIIQFDRPDIINLFVRVTVRPSVLNVQTVIPDIVMSYQDGEIDGQTGLVVGSAVSTWEISGAVNQVEPTIFVKKVELSTDGVSWSTDIFSVALNERALINRSSVLVVVE